MIPVEVKKVKIGEGIPKICVPIVGKTKNDIMQEAKTFHELPLDLVEWRVDWYEDVFQVDKVLETAKELRKVLGDTPIVFTFRTLNEGGEKAIEKEVYVNLLQAVAESGYIDLLDVEVFTGDAIVKNLVEIAHKAGVKVIASNHDFEKTPDKEEIIRRLCLMQELGADIPKIAVMPQCRQDVLTLLAATCEMYENHAKCPIVTMSMAGTGMNSRLSGETFGSAITFGAAKKASAPGQIAVGDLSNVLKILHNA